MDTFFSFEVADIILPTSEAFCSRLPSNIATFTSTFLSRT